MCPIVLLSQGVGCTYRSPTGIGKCTCVTSHHVHHHQHHTIISDVQQGQGASGESCIDRLLEQIINRKYYVHECVYCLQKIIHSCMVILFFVLSLKIVESLITIVQNVSNFPLLKQKYFMGCVSSVADCRLRIVVNTGDLYFGLCQKKREMNYTSVPFRFEIRRNITMIFLYCLFYFQSSVVPTAVWVGSCKWNPRWKNVLKSGEGLLTSNLLSSQLQH